MEKSTKKTRFDVERIRAVIKKRKLKRMELVKTPVEPRYDEVYEEGIKWLDTL